MIRRVTYLAVYAALAALGEAAVARPALLWVRSQGLFRPALAWEVPFGALLLGCAALVATFTFAFALRVALGRPPRLPLHVAFLLLVGICLAVRFASGDPRPPRDARPALLEGLRAAAAELDRAYSGRYTPDAGQFGSALASVPPLPYRRLGRGLRLHARILSGADGPQLERLPGDDPGTLYVAVSRDRHSAWLTALALDGILRLPAGAEAIVFARQGTHSEPGKDPGLPAYPAGR